jgi:hypothetical protein
MNRTFRYLQALGQLASGKAAIGLQQQQGGEQAVGAHEFYNPGHNYDTG